MYRENLWNSGLTYDTRTSTDMIVELNDKLDSVVSLELTNISIPFTFYNIDETHGNNYFYVEQYGGSFSKISISSDSSC